MLAHGGEIPGNIDDDGAQRRRVEGLNWFGGRRSGAMAAGEVGGAGGHGHTLPVPRIRQ